MKQLENVRTSLLLAIFTLLLGAYSYGSTLNTLDSNSNQISRIEQQIQNLQDSLSSIKTKPEKAKIIPEDTVWVTHSDTKLWPIYLSYGPFTPAQRANQITDILNGSSIFHLVNNVDSLRISETSNGYKIHTHKSDIFYVSNDDAQLLGTTSKKLSTQYKNKLAKQVEMINVIGNNKDLLWRIGLAIGALIALYLVLKLVNLGYKWLNRYLFKLKQGKHIDKVSVKGFDIINATQIKKLILYFTRAIKLFVTLFLIYISLLFIFGLFPWTEPIAHQLIGYVISPLKNFFFAILAYIPNLISLVIILYIGKILSQFLTYISNEVASGSLEINGFYPEWAKPTLNLVKFALYIVILIFAFPLLPGSDSDIFKGVSVFVGILITMGSSSAVTNAVGGLVLTYMRPFKKGDRVQIDGKVGFVIEKSMLVTRIRTAKQEIVTIPNAKVLSANSINYSTSIQENDGIIVHNSVTIGYDVPWRKVHEALLEAASKIKNVSQEPEPFVMQLALKDFYVEYEINAYVKNVKAILGVQSELNANIQDVFRDYGIEVLSPHFEAQREGDESTIPKKDKSEKNFTKTEVTDHTPELDAQEEEEKNDELNQNNSSNEKSDKDINSDKK